MLSKLSSSSGCLVIHGLTGTPATIASIADPLRKSGFLVKTPLLAGHGGSVDGLAVSRWQDWYKTIHTAYTELQKEVDKVFLAGISLGALLGLKLAIDVGDKISGLSLIGTPLKLTTFNRIAIPMVRYSPLRYIIKSIPKDYDKSILDPISREKYRKLTLSTFPSESIFQLYDFIHEIDSKIERIKNPLLIIHGEHDQTAPTSNVDLLEKRTSSTIIERLLLKNSAHVVTMDFEKEVAADATLKFFKKLEGKGNE